MHQPAKLPAPFSSRLLLTLLAWFLPVGVLPAALRVEPVRVVLDSPEATQQLLVTGGNSVAPTLSRPQPRSTARGASSLRSPPANARFLRFKRDSRGERSCM